MIGLELALICAGTNCNECPEKVACERFIEEYDIVPSKILKVASWSPDSIKGTYFDLSLHCLARKNCTGCAYYSGQKCEKGMDGEYDPGDFLLELCKEV